MPDGTKRFAKKISISAGQPAAPPKFLEKVRCIQPIQKQIPLSKRYTTSLTTDENYELLEELTSLPVPSCASIPESIARPFGSIQEVNFAPGAGVPGSGGNDGVGGSGGVGG